jgi:hypothetical protein
VGGSLRGCPPPTGTAAHSGSAPTSWSRCRLGHTRCPGRAGAPAPAPEPRCSSRLRRPCAAGARMPSSHLAAAAASASDNPALRVAVPLAGIHALPAHHVRQLPLSQVNVSTLPAGTGADRARPIHTCWRAGTRPPQPLAWGRSGWPGSSVACPSALTSCGRTRIVEEATATGADPLHLAHVFSPGAKTSLRQAQPSGATAAELDSTSP